jgi:hypothetical protein
MPLATPYPRSYWVVPGQLLAGFYPGDLHRDGAIAKIDALIDCRIRSVVDLTEDNGRDLGAHADCGYGRAEQNCHALSAGFYRPLAALRSTGLRPLLGWVRAHGCSRWLLYGSAQYGRWAGRFRAHRTIAQRRRGLLYELAADRSTAADGARVGAGGVSS